MDIFKAVKTTKRFKEIIWVNISDEVCQKFGFSHDEIAVHPIENILVKILGVAPGNKGEDVLWYTIQHPGINGEACYYGGAKYLPDAGFKKFNQSN